MAAVERLRLARGAGEFGIALGEPRVDFGALMARKAAVVAQQRGGVEHLLKGRKVEVVAGHGRLLDAHTVRVSGAAGGGEPRPRGRRRHRGHAARGPPCRPCSRSPTRGS